MRRDWALRGFCWGGRITLLFAEHNLAREGRRGLVRPATGRCQPLAAEASPDRRRRAICTAPVRGLSGGADGGIPLDTIDKMKAALAQGSPAAQQESSSRSIPTRRMPSQNADYRPSYRKRDAAEDGWKGGGGWGGVCRCIEWFKRPTAFSLY